MKTLIAILFLMLSPLTHADIFVIVNASNPTQNMDIQEVAALYLGKKQTFPQGGFARVFDCKNNDEVRESFFLKIAGMNLPRINAYWARLSFAGQETPPQFLPSEQAVLENVRKNRNAIGYVSALPKTPDVRVVLHLKD